jgi:hypothetical protein
MLVLAEPLCQRGAFLDAFGQPFDECQDLPGRFLQFCRDGRAPTGVYFVPNALDGSFLAQHGSPAQACSLYGLAKSLLGIRHRVPEQQRNPGPPLPWIARCGRHGGLRVPPVARRAD